MLGFRVWDMERKEFVAEERGFSIYRDGTLFEDDVWIEHNYPDSPEYIPMQSTGLKDCNNAEIFEFTEIDFTFEVSYGKGGYILTNISNGDIISLYDYWRIHNGQISVSREYTKV